MDLNNKLKGLPHIYYFNLDNRVDRKEYMENQFEKWNIKNYTRVSGTKYLESEWKKWIHLVDNARNIKKTSVRLDALANMISHIDFLFFWLESTNDENLILMEDDYDLNLIEYWHFDWEYLMNNIPYDWDCIQLGYESNNHINFFLSPKPSFRTFFGPCLLNRIYVKKLVNLFYDQQKNIFKVFKNNEFVGVDNTICENGKCYCLPLITTNNDLKSGENSIERIHSHHVQSRKLYYFWWKKQRDKITLEEFFNPNSKKMTLPVFYDKQITSK
jgi:hypothetical protein